MYGDVYGDDGWEQPDRGFAWRARHAGHGEETLEACIAQAAGLPEEEAARLAAEASREWAERRATEEGTRYEMQARLGAAVFVATAALSALGALAAVLGLATAARRLARLAS